MTSEKVSPSPISMFADVSMAISVEKRMGKQKMPLRDLLNRIVADYNRMTTIRKHRIDSNRKNLVYNLWLDKAIMEVGVAPFY